MRSLHLLDGNNWMAILALLGRNSCYWSSLGLIHWIIEMMPHIWRLSRNFYLKCQYLGVQSIKGFGGPSWDPRSLAQLRQFTNFNFYLDNKKIANNCRPNWQNPEPDFRLNWLIFLHICFYIWAQRWNDLKEKSFWAKEKKVWPKAQIRVYHRKRFVCTDENCFKFLPDCWELEFPNWISLHIKGAGKSIL